MPHLVLTQKGYAQLVAACGSRPPSPLWLNAGILSCSQVADLRAQGLSITEFAGAIPLRGHGLHAAIGTIEEHHPGASIWVEHVAQP